MNVNHTTKVRFDELLDEIAYLYGRAAKTTAVSIIKDCVVEYENELRSKAKQGEAGNEKK